MVKERSRYAFRFIGTQPVGLLMFDAVRTLLEPPHGQTFAAYGVRLAEKVLRPRRPITVAPDKIEAYTNECRVRMNTSPLLAKTSLTGPDYRAALNVSAYTHFGYRFTLADGIRLSQLFSRGIESFIMSEEKRRFVVELIARARAINPKVKIVIATNARHKVVRGLLRRNGIGHLFDEVYSAGQLGFSKPHPEFFRKILALTGVKASEARMVGNSAFNDLAAAVLRIMTLWLSFSSTDLSWDQVATLHGPNAASYIIKARTIKEARQIIGL